MVRDNGDVGANRDATEFRSIERRVIDAGNRQTVGNGWNGYLPARIRISRDGDRTVIGGEIELGLHRSRLQQQVQAGQQQNQPA